MDQDFNLKMSYKKFIHKFELPNIKEKVPKIIKRKLDVAPYNRVLNVFYL